MPRKQRAAVVYPTAEERTEEVVRLRGRVEALETVLRSLISSGGTSPIIRAMAMNTLEAGSGDAWLAKRGDGEDAPVGLDGICLGCGQRWADCHKTHLRPTAEHKGVPKEDDRG